MSQEKPKLLIVDDDEGLRTQMKWAFVSEFEVLLAEDRTSALQTQREHQPVLVTLDLGLPPSPNSAKEGMAILAQMIEHDSSVKVVVITGQDEKEHALEAIAQGAYDFFSKPIRIEELGGVLKRALYLHGLESENRRLKDSLGEGEQSFQGMVGASSQMQDVFAAIRKVASSEAPVLIEGESGTGKELAARAVHRLSRRSKKPFVAINCGAIPENLLESELFGHEKGAFTGAHAQRPGQIETAQGGTLFLDEIGELPLALQVKLLRFLQEGTIQRVGGRKEIMVDVRVLAATNVELERAMSEGRFREDLYYRIAVVTVRMPNLQERQGDVLLLAKVFLDRYAADNRKKITGFTAKALQSLETHAWPGNVREIENRVRRAVIMAEKSQISPADLGLASGYERYEGMSLREAREALERELVERALARNQGNVSRASAELEVSRPTLYELMDKLGIERKHSAKASRNS